MQYTTLESINSRLDSVYLSREIYGDIEESIVKIFNGDLETIIEQIDEPTGRLENIVGIYYRHVNNDEDKAKEYLQKSAIKNNYNAFSNLADLEADYSKKIELFKLAIFNGDPRSYTLTSMARIMLVRNFERGFLTTQSDEIEAHNTFIKAIQMGDVYAMYLMSILYFQYKKINTAKFYAYLSLTFVNKQVFYSADKLTEKLNRLLEEINKQEEFMIKYHGYVPSPVESAIFDHNGIIDLSNIEESLKSEDRY